MVLLLEIRTAADVEFPTGAVDEDDKDPVADPPLLLPAMVPPAMTTAAAAKDGCDPSIDFVAVESSAIFYHIQVRKLPF